jgi:hypothetical protein
VSELRRTVRATRGFFDDLDRQLPAERGDDGRPSRADFQALDLLRIVEEFATGFDEMLELIPGRPQYRVLIGTGTVVQAFSVIAQLAPDGAVELTQLDIDTELSW